MVFLCIHVCFSQINLVLCCLILHVLFYVSVQLLHKFKIHASDTNQTLLKVSLLAGIKVPQNVNNKFMGNLVLSFF